MLVCSSDVSCRREMVHSSGGENQHMNASRAGCPETSPKKFGKKGDPFMQLPRLGGP